MPLKKKQDLPYIILGAGGHAKVIIETLQVLKFQIAGIINPQIPLHVEQLQERLMKKVLSAFWDHIY